MSKRASPTAIGAFVVGGIALAVIGLLVFGSGRFFQHPLKYALFFDTSVEGLNVGAPVQWRGVKIGQVSRIEARWNTPWIEVIIDVDLQKLQGGRNLTPEEFEQAIERAVKENGLRAQLQTQSLLTGQLFVAIDLFPGTEVRLVHLDKTLPELPVVPSPLQLFSQRAEKLLDTLTSLPLNELVMSTTHAVDAINKVASSKELQQTLEQAKGALDDMRALARTLNEQGGPVLASAKETLDITRAAVADISLSTQRLLDRVDTDARSLNALLEEARVVVQKTGGEVESVATSLRARLEEARAVLARAESALAAFEATAAKAQGTLGAMNSALGGDTPLGYHLVDTLQEVAAASRAIRTLADYLDQHPDALLTGKGSPGGK